MAAGPDERELLLSSLANQRAHVLGIMEGLDDEQLRRPVLASGWSCAGMLHHLALGVERFWFRTVFSQEVPLDPDEPSDWEVPPGDATAALALYRDEVAAADRVIAAASLDEPPAYWPTELFGTWRLESLRALVLHVITETACHAGHLDAVRELLDGRTWLRL